MPPIHNAIKYGTDLLRGYSRAVGLGEEEEGAVRLGETLTPVLDLWTLPEWARLRGETLGGGSFDVTGAAGEVGQVILFNPEASRRLVVLESLSVEAIATAVDVFYRLFRGASPAGFVANNSGPLDTRSNQLIAAAGTVAQVLQDSVVAAVGGLPFDFIRLAANLWTLDDRGGVVLAPGTGFAFNTTTVATRQVGGLRWRERQAFPAERE